MNCHFVLILGLYVLLYGRFQCFLIVYKVSGGKKIVSWLYWDMEATTKTKASFVEMM